MWPRSSLDQIRPGMGFPSYMFWFMLRSPIGWVLAAVSVIAFGIYI